MNPSFKAMLLALHSMDAKLPEPKEYEDFCRKAATIRSDAATVAMDYMQSLTITDGKISVVDAFWLARICYAEGGKAALLSVGGRDES